MKPRSQSLVTMFPYRQSADGCPLCVICGAELRRMDGLPRRKDSRYCSDRCCDEAWVRAGITARIRQLLLGRDQGRCSRCGLDCLKVQRSLELLGRYYGPFVRELFYDLPADRAYAWRIVNDIGRRLSVAFRLRVVSLGWDAGQHTWEAHHVVPVSEGGGGCGLEGYATLCRRCHKRTSAKLAARRASPVEEAGPLGQMALPFA